MTRIRHVPGAEEIDENLGLSFEALLVSMQDNLAGQVHRPRIESMPDLSSGGMARTALVATSNPLATVAETYPVGETSFDVRAYNDLPNAFFRSWASVGRIFDFYQRYIRREGYLRTAQEDFSLTQLARMAGVEQTPALSASTLVSLQSRGGGKSRETIVQQGSQLLGASASGIPVFFETVADLSTRPEWNQLPLRQGTVALEQTLQTGTVEVILASTLTIPNPGDVMLFADGSVLGASLCGIVAVVTPNKAGGWVSVRFETTLAGTASAPLLQLEAFLFRRSTTLFGATAPQWSSMSDVDKSLYAPVRGGVAQLHPGEADPVLRGLPPAAVRCLLAAVDGTLFAATASGLYRLRPGQDSWSLTPAGQARSPLSAIAQASDGTLYAGGAKGLLLRSDAIGEDWNPMLSAASVTPASMLLGRSWRLPETDVLCIVPMPLNHLAPDSGTIMVGTGMGVYHAMESSATWTPANQGLPGYDSSSHRASVTVSDLLCNPTSGQVYAATSRGIFRADKPGGDWKDFNQGLAKDVPVIAKPASSDAAAPATPAPVFRSLEKDIAATEASAKKLPGLLSTLSTLLPGTAKDLQNPAKAAPALLKDAVEASHASHTSANAGVAVPMSSLLWLPPAKGQPGAVLAGGPSGLYRLNSPWDRWEKLTLADPVTSLAWIDSSATLVAGTPAGIVRSTDRASTWTAVEWEGRSVRSLATRDGDLWAGAAFKSVDAVEWPGFDLQPGTLDVDRSGLQLQPGTWAVLRNGTKVLPFRILSSQAVTRAAFRQQRSVTALGIDASHDLTAFSRRDASIYLNPVSIRLMTGGPQPPAAFTGDRLVLQDLVDIPAGRAAIVSGKPPSIALLAPLGGVLQPDAKQVAPLLPRQSILRVTSTSSLACAQTAEGLYLIAANPDGTLRCDRVAVADSDTVIALAVGTIYAYSSGYGLVSIAISATHSAPSQPVSLAPPARFGKPVSMIVSEDASNPTVWVTDGSLVLRWAKGDTPLQVLPQGGLEAISTLLLSPQGDLLAASLDGLFSYGANGWSQAGLSGREITQMASATGNSVAATPAGVFQLATADAWQLLPLLPSPPQSVAVSSSGEIVALTRDGQLARLPKGATVWAPLNAGLIGRPTGMAYLGQTLLVATLPELNLPASHPAAPAIDPGDLDVQPMGSLSGYFVAALDLGLVQPELVTALKALQITLPTTAIITPALPGSRWVLQDVTNGGDMLLLERSALGLSQQPSFDVFRLPRLSLTSIQPGVGGAESWTLATGTGASFTATPNPSDLAVQSSQDWIDLSFEVAEVSSTPFPGIVTLLDPLTGLYDPATVSLAANVVAARHSTMVSDEVLGSGSSAMAFQRFKLSRTPLTQTAAKLVSGLKGDSLTIRVTAGSSGGPMSHAPSTQSPEPSGIRTPETARAEGTVWTQVPTLIGSGPSDQHYMVLNESDGSVSVVFGDGLTGARLPTGSENVRADYLAGAGAAGNLPANTISTGKRTPLGLFRISQPMPAVGGADATQYRDVRQMISRQANLDQSVVSRADLERFAHQSSGIDKAIAESVRTGGLHCIALTVSGENSLPVDASVLTQLATDLSLAGADMREVFVLRHTPVPLAISLDLIASTEAEFSALDQTLRACLASRFSFERMTFGQMIAASTIVAMVQDVQGVAGCVLQTLHRRQDPRTLESTLRALPARRKYESQTIAGAELFSLDTFEDVRISIRRAS